MTNSATDNRREHRRILVSKPATVTKGSLEYSGKILNISAGGAGIRLDVQLLDNTQITVNIDNVGTIPAKVVRQMQDGVGVKFDLSEEKEQRFIQQITEIVEKKRKESSKESA
ncbi:MAG: PilZ domain-containing protein [Sneathiella sp.]|nr:PilZ domain-containing protein [Sneathiella sp.]